MRARTVRTTVAALLFGLGCGGLGGGGAGGCAPAGCGGCAGCAPMEPIPGGFPADERRGNAITTRFSPRGFDFLEGQVGDLIAAQVGSGGAAGLGLDVPCTESEQRFNIVGGVTARADVFACDLDGDQACTAADADPALRTDVAPHGRTCGVEADVQSVDLAPSQNADGTVDVTVTLNMLVKTGRIPVRIVAYRPRLFPPGEVPLCTMSCGIEFDSDRNAPPTLPFEVVVKLRVDPASGDILAFDFDGIEEITDAIEPDELTITSEGGSCSFGCSILGNDFVKPLLFSQIGPQIEGPLRDALDAVRCRPCDAVTAACPAPSACDVDTNLCYTNKAQHQCPPMFPGLEGRSAIAGPGGPPSELDLSIVAGGRNADGTPSHSGRAGGLTVALMAGSRAPTPSPCIPLAAFADRPTPPQLDFDAEAQVAGPDRPAPTDYALGLSLSDTFLDRTLHHAWEAGVVCLSVDGETTSLLSSGLFAPFLPSLDLLTHGDDVPMAVVLRPRTPPSVLIGRGTVKPGPDGTPIPDDPLLTLSMNQLQIDFYAELEERLVRLFSLTADVTVPLGLEFDPVLNTVLPVLGSLETLLANVQASNSEMLAEDPQELAALIGGLVGLAQPALAGALSPIELPELQGFRLKISEARGAVPLVSEPGYHHLAMFAALEAAPPGNPFTARADTRANLAGVRTEGIRTVATVDVEGRGLTHRGLRGYDYSFRVNGGLWSPWLAGPRLEIAAPVLALQGRHRVELRARELGVPGTADTTPAVVVVEVDTVPPTVRLEIAPDADVVRTVAHDAVTPEHALAFRYRVADDAWSEPGAARAYTLAELDPARRLEVEVLDLAGLSGRATFDARGTDGAAPTADDRSTGCATGGAPLAAGLLGLSWVRRRRARAG